MTEPATNPDFAEDAQSGQIASRVNWLRAGVMGANDGIVSTASMVVGVAGELDRERSQLKRNPGYGLRQLTGLIQAQGIDGELAHKVAVQLSAKDPLAAHARLELGIDPAALSNPWYAASPRCWPSASAA
jgi:VIT1/CCC1 family predicted Fe2+/Mn2+ transporter